MNVPLWVAILPALVALGVGVATYFHNRMVLKETRRHNQATIEEARLQKREEFIEQALSEFYYPAQGYLQVTKSLHHILAAEKPSEFRLLSYLIDPTQTYEVGGAKVRVDLSSNDRELIGEIIDVEKKLEEIFLTKSGLVDDPSLISNYEPNLDITDIKLKIRGGIGLISLAVAHFRVLRLAFEGKLKGDPKAYEQFVFPRELPIKITENLEALRKTVGTLENRYLTEAGEGPRLLS